VSKLLIISTRNIAKCNAIFNYILLNKRRDYLQQFICLQKLLNNSIDCPHLLQQLKCRTNNKSTRNQNCFLINNISKKYLRFSPANILTVRNTTELNLF